MHFSIGGAEDVEGTVYGVEEVAPMPQYFIRRRGLPARITQVTFGDEEGLKSALEELPEGAHSLTDGMGETHEDLDLGLGFHREAGEMLGRCERHRWRLVQAEGIEVFLLGVMALGSGARGVLAGMIGMVAVEAILIVDILSFGVFLRKSSLEYESAQNAHRPPP